jgi:hypothetical protein
MSNSLRESMTAGMPTHISGIVMDDPSIPSGNYARIGNMTMVPRRRREGAIDGEENVIAKDIVARIRDEHDNIIETRTLKTDKDLRDLCPGMQAAEPQKAPAQPTDIERFQEPIEDDTQIPNLHALLDQLKPAEDPMQQAQPAGGINAVLVQLLKEVLTDKQEKKAVKPKQEKNLIRCHFTIPGFGTINTSYKSVQIERDFIVASIDKDTEQSFEPASDEKPLRFACPERGIDTQVVSVGLSFNYLGDKLYIFPIFKPE